MEGDRFGTTPCSSRAVASAINGTAVGAIWGLCTAPREARAHGLVGTERANYVARVVGKSSFHLALITAVVVSADCGLQRYRKKDDWVHSMIVGAAGGAAWAAAIGNWRSMFRAACLISAGRFAYDHVRRNGYTL